MRQFCNFRLLILSLALTGLWACGSGEPKPNEGEGNLGDTTSTVVSSDGENFEMTVPQKTALKGTWKWDKEAASAHLWATQGQLSPEEKKMMESMVAPLVDILVQSRFVFEPDGNYEHSQIEGKAKKTVTRRGTWRLSPDEKHLYTQLPGEGELRFDVLELSDTRLKLKTKPKSSAVEEVRILVPVN